MVLLTNRQEIIQTTLLRKLRQDKNINFDYILFRKTDRSKSKRLSKLIDKLTDVAYIEFYDDKMKHIDDINSLKEKYPQIIIKTIKIEII
jgi:hypothetical protein